MLGVAGRHQHVEGSGDPRAVLHPLHPPGLDQRHEVVLEVRGLVPRVGTDRLLVLPPVEVIGGVRKGRDDPVSLPPGGPAGVVEVEVRIDHDVDVFRRDPELVEVAE